MKAKTDLLFFYAQKMNFLSFDDFIEILNQSSDTEEYLKKKNLPQLSIDKIKLILFKHYFLMVAQEDKLLSKEQMVQLINRKIEEIINSTPPFSLFSLNLQIFPLDYFKVVLERLEQEKIFLLRELTNLIPNVLTLPEQYHEVLKELKQKKIPTITRQILEKEEENFLLYNILCRCGNSIILEVEWNSKAKVYCKTCNVTLLDLAQKSLLKDSTLKIESAYKKLTEDEEKLNVANMFSDEQKFADYIIMEKAGEGANSKVYKAKDIKTGEIIALKILQKSKNEKEIKYFLREIEILSKLDNPNIVSIKKSGKYKEILYFTMEYISGMTLLSLLNKRKEISLPQILKIISNVLNALIYARQYNLVHRDVKPANIFISTKGQVKLIDLGIAKILEDSQGLTRSDQMMGTPYYMAPEQIKNSKYVNEQADIYSVGATLYHCLCGVPPFSENSSMMLTLTKKIKDEYIRIEERLPDLPTEIISIINKSMHFKLQDRYGSALEMKNDIKHFKDFLRKKNE